jgi:hypothetical protein
MVKDIQRKGHPLTTDVAQQLQLVKHCSSHGKSGMRAICRHAFTWHDTATSKC